MNLSLFPAILSIDLRQGYGLIGCEVYVRYEEIPPSSKKNRTYIHKLSVVTKYYYKTKEPLCCVYL